MDDEHDEDEYGPIDESYGSAGLPGFGPMDGPGLFDDPEPGPLPVEQTGPGLFAEDEPAEELPAPAPATPAPVNATRRTPRPKRRSRSTAGTGPTRSPR
ncbi:hypothetical protein G7085_14310 [Tessaracoccus sp. HDW20]|nr:hypothetical protein [Tessaracoccus coleopterorum]NHB85395.1 hypothetical protein [Tessaracoccus coleopterorum]